MLALKIQVLHVENQLDVIDVIEVDGCSLKIRKDKKALIKIRGVVKMVLL